MADYHKTLLLISDVLVNLTARLLDLEKKVDELRRLTLQGGPRYGSLS